MKELLEGLQIKQEQRVRTTRRAAWYRKASGKLLWIGVAAVTLVAVGSWRLVAARALPVEIFTVSAPTGAGAATPTLTAGGYVRAAKVVYVVPKVPGRIAVLKVAEGDQVQGGDVLAVLDGKDLEQEAAEARANYELARANFTKLESGSRREDVAEARARVDALLLSKEKAGREAARSKSLFEAGFLSAQALDQAETEHLVGAKNLEAARQALLRVEAGPREEEIVMAGAALAAARARWVSATNRLGYATIKAPVSGRVLRKFSDVGDFVSPGVPYLEGYDTLAAGSPVVSLADLGKQEISADINETDIGKVRLRQPVDVSPNAFPDEVFHGFVTQISPRADKNKNTIEVKATIERSARVLPYDMSVKVAYLEEPSATPRPRGVRIPSTAVVERGGKQFVFVVSDSRAVQRAVELGVRDQDMVLVQSGLVDGDRVIASRLDDVTDGKRIALK